MFQQPNSYWDYFFLTGNIDAYLISKQLEKDHQREGEEELFSSEDSSS